MALTLPDLAEAVRHWVADNLPGRTPLRIQIFTVEDGQEPISLPIPAAIKHVDDSESVFVPNAFQQAILDALEGKAMRTDALAAKVGDRSRLFSKPRGGLPELKDQGLVGHHARLGYYSTSAPPPEVSEPSN